VKEEALSFKIDGVFAPGYEKKNQNPQMESCSFTVNRLFSLSLLFFFACQYICRQHFLLSPSRIGNGLALTISKFER